MSMSVDGLVSGMDTTTLISQLLQAEAAPQTALKTRLTAAQTAASAYRTVNTTIAAVRAAAEALTSTALSAGRKASSTTASVTVSASPSAVVGNSLTFTPTQVAGTHTVLSKTEWNSLTQKVRDVQPAWPIEIRKPDGTLVGSINVGPDATLSEAVTAINATNFGVKASVVSLGANKYRLQFSADKSGEAGAFIVRSATETDLNQGSGFNTTQQGQDAILDLGLGVLAKSATNTFTDLMPGVSVTISKPDASTTVSVAADHDAVAGKMQTLVDSVNSALSTIKTYTSNATGSTAALKGDFSVTSIAGRLLGAVSQAVGADGSPAKIGLQLTKDGKVTFDKAKFTTALKDTPDLAQRMVGGTPAAGGVAAVAGIAQRLGDVAKTASDSTTGSLTAMANGRDSIAKDIQNRIASWDLRLAKRKEMLTRQFSAMETALSGLKNQSTWLAGQINSLPTG